MARKRFGRGWDVVMPRTDVSVQYNPAYDGLAPHDVGVITCPWAFPGVVHNDAPALSKDSPNGLTMSAYGYGISTSMPRTMTGKVGGGE